MTTVTEEAEGATPAEDKTDAKGDDATSDTTKARSKPDYSLQVVGEAFPEDDRQERKTKPRGPSTSIAALLQPIVDNTELWSVEGQVPVVLRVVEYTTRTGAKNAHKNILAHPEKVPVHEGAVEGSAEWEFKDVLAYRYDEDGKQIPGSRHGALYAAYHVTADEYLRVTSKPKGEGDNADDGYDDAGFPK